LNLHSVEPNLDTVEPNFDPVEPNVDPFEPCLDPFEPVRIRCQSLDYQANVGSQPLGHDVEVTLDLFRGLSVNPTPVVASLTDPPSGHRAPAR